MRGHIKRCAGCRRTMRERRCSHCGSKRFFSWGYVIDVGRDDDGNRQQKAKAGFDTRRDAEEAMRKEIERLAGGGDPFPEKITFGKCVRRWLKDSESRLRPRTHERYRSLLEGNALPILRNGQLDRIRPGHIREVLTAMKERGRAPRTIIQGRAVLSSVLNQALQDGLIVANPVRAVKPPKAERPRLVVPTPEQLAAVIETAKTEKVWEIPVLLAATTGARRAEVLALGWPEVDLRAGKVRIVRSLSKGEAGRRPAIGELKTARARRELVPVVIERLRQYKKEQNERRLKLGPAWHDEHDLVCDRGDGKWLTPDAFTDGIMKHAGLDPRTRLHDLRHAVATAMLGAGVHPAIASAVLGHSSPSFIMSVYQHVTDQMTEQAATALGRALEGG